MKERMRTGETRLEIRKQIMEKIGHEKLQKIQKIPFFWEGGRNLNFI